MRGGFSLVEAVMALALLATCFFLLFPVFQFALQYSARVEQTTLATSIARSKLAEIRDFARRKSSPGYNYDQLATAFPPAPDANHPEYLLTVTFSPVTLYSPCRQFALSEPDDAKRRALRSSCQRVEVKVTWTGGEVQLVSLVGAPARRLRAVAPLVLSGGGAAVAHDATTSYTVTAFDEDDQEIPDVFFHWGVRALDGRGRLASISPDTRSCQLQNRIHRNDGGTQYTGGSCGVAARVVYAGRSCSAVSLPAVLTP